MECSICLENIKNENKYILDCNHTFHRSCLLYVDNQLCPLCRKPFILGNVGFGLKKICRCPNGYSPFAENCECRFCLGFSIDKILELNTI